tara:strand:+ start:1978 stop:2298 length:321 start_codon:yes stop_codon:yes gene_type:complete
MGHYHKGPKMESAKQEKYNLMHDNPVAKDASGGRSWMSKHATPFSMGYGESGLKANHSAMEMNHGDSAMEMNHDDSPVEGNAFTKAMKDSGGDYEKAKAMLQMKKY